MGGLSRRHLLRGGVVAAGGVVAGLAAPKVRSDFGPRRLPLGGGYAPAADQLDRVVGGRVDVVWRALTKRRAIALTFDDGPGPRWTPMVLDALAEHGASATFFVVGERLLRYGHLLEGRLGAHELGNHSWTHADLAEADVADAFTELTRTAGLIAAVAGTRSRLFRPPYGHLGGAALLAAQQTDHDVVLWSRQAHEITFHNDPAGLVADIVDAAVPGDIVLCHDYGDRSRLITVRQVGKLVTALRDRGFELVTVSQLGAPETPESKAS
jgi:peptidoglycan-N-acetylglucosamine deacetylase